MQLLLSIIELFTISYREVEVGKGYSTISSITVLSCVPSAAKMGLLTEIIQHIGR